MELLVDLRIAEQKLSSIFSEMSSKYDQRENS